MLTVRDAVGRWGFAEASALLALGAFLTTQAPAMLVVPSLSFSLRSDEAVRENDPPPAPGKLDDAHRGGLIISAYGGAPYTHASDVAFDHAGEGRFTVRNVGWQGKPFEDPYYYGLRVAKWSSRAPVGLMLDFTHAKAIADTAQPLAIDPPLSGTPAKTIGDKLRKLEFSHGHNTLVLNLLYRLPGGGRVRPYAGLGLGVALPHTEIWFADAPRSTRTYTYQFAGPVLQILGGLELRTRGRFSTFVEYKFSLSRYAVPLTPGETTWLFGDLANQFAHWRSGAAAADGTAATNLATHQWIGGINIDVGGAAKP